MASAAASGSAPRSACLNTRSPPIGTPALLLARRGVSARHPAVARRGGSRPLRDQPAWGDGQVSTRPVFLDPVERRRHPTRSVAARLCDAIAPSGVCQPIRTTSRADLPKIAPGSRYPPVLRAWPAGGCALAAGGGGGGAIIRTAGGFLLGNVLAY